MILGPLAKSDPLSGGLSLRPIHGGWGENERLWMTLKIKPEQVVAMWRALPANQAAEGGNDPYVAALGSYHDTFGRFPSEEPDYLTAYQLCDRVAFYSTLPHPLTGFSPFYRNGVFVPSGEIPPDIAAAIRWEIEQGAAGGTMTVDGVEYAWD